MLCTWIGTSGRPLRWAESMGLIKGVSVRAPRSGLSHYVIATKPNRAGRILTLAIEDGLVMLCWSADPDAVEVMQQSLRDHRPGRWSRDRGLAADDPPDRGVVSLPSNLRPRYVISPLRWTLASVEPARVRLDLSGRLALERAAPLADGGAATVLPRLLGDAPHAIAALPVGYLQTLLPRHDAAVLSSVLQGVAEETPGGHGDFPFYVALLGDEFSGRIGRDMVYFLGVGIKVPTLVLAAPVADEARGAAAWADALDRVNRAYRAGLIQHSEPYGNRVIYTMEGTAENFYGNLARDEQFAYTFCDGWMIFCSNAAVLKSLLDRYDRGDTGEGTPLFGDPSDAPPAPSTACVRLDFRKLQSSLKSGIALYKFFIPRTEEGERRRENLVRLESGLEALAALHTSTLWVAEDGELMAATLQFGDGVAATGATRIVDIE
jgi:hypothetical protein